MRGSKNYFEEEKWTDIPHRYVDIFFLLQESFYSSVNLGYTRIDLIALTDENSVIYSYFKLFS